MYVCIILVALVSVTSAKNAYNDVGCFVQGECTEQAINSSPVQVCMY